VPSASACAAARRGTPRPRRGLLDPDKPRSPAGCGVRRPARPGRPGHTIGSLAAPGLPRPCAGGRPSRASPAFQWPARRSWGLGKRDPHQLAAAPGRALSMPVGSGCRTWHFGRPTLLQAAAQPVPLCTDDVRVGAQRPHPFWVCFRPCSEAAQLSSVGTAQHTCRGVVHACTRLGQLVWQAHRRFKLAGPNGSAAGCQWCLAGEPMQSHTPQDVVGGACENEIERFARRRLANNGPAHIAPRRRFAAPHRRHTRERVPHERRCCGIARQWLPCCK
jgi:hypothetical protein